MSYQVKLTPFFRRMVSISKKNGQLQRLKEEYERIKEFNDRTIEMKMRRVRLKRPFREIEEIKESSSQCKRRRISTERSKTNEEKRAQTLVKAKELGKQYSKMSALVERCASRVEAASSGAAVGGMFSRMELERKQRSDKHINIQKLTTSPQIRAKQHWRNLALIVRQRNMHPLVDNQEDSSEEYTLREISNTTDLTLRQLKSKTSPSNSENDLLPGEVLLSVESLHPVEMQSLPALKTTAAEKPSADKGGSPIDPLRKVQQYVKMFEPIVRDVARKEVLEFGIEKLRSIFEHQSVEQ